jgi:hypothetical protein
MKKTYYIDKNTRIVWRYAASLLDKGHVLERRKKFLGIGYWVETSSAHEGIHVTSKDMDGLIKFLLRHEQNVHPKKRQWPGYPKQPKP